MPLDQQSGREIKSQYMIVGSAITEDAVLPSSHCVISMGRTRVPGAPSLLLLNLESGDVNVLRLPAALQLATVATGTVASREHIFLAVQILRDVESHFYTGSYFLAALNRADLSLAGLHPLDGCRDVHSVCLNGDTLYVVSTGTDEVLSLRLKGAEVTSRSVLWRPEPNLPLEDTHHLNSIAVWNGNVIVSGFGRRSGSLWRSATDGFIHDITQGERLQSGVFQPHSLTLLEDDLIFCESRRQAVRSLRSGREQCLGGYTRGVCAAGGHLLVAVSRGRTRSNSTGLLESWGSPGGSGGQCGVYKLDPKTFAVEGFTDLIAYGDEVAGLLPVTGTGQWPTAGEIKWRDACIAGIESGLERLRIEHQRNSDDYQAALDALRLEMQSKVEEANEIIAGLHQKVDEQSAWALRTYEQVKERDSIIQALQVQLQEQSDWAVASAEQVRQRDSIIRMLQAQPEKTAS